MHSLTKTAIVALLALDALALCSAGARLLTRPAEAQTITVDSRTNGYQIVGTRTVDGITSPPTNLVFMTQNNGGMFIGPQFPAGAVYHQVVDRYFDRDGNPIEATSRTHSVDADCNPGRRLPQDLVAQDDGKGGMPRFAMTRLPSEPTTGVKPITAEGLIKARLAMKPNPVSETQVAEAHGN